MSATDIQLKHNEYAPRMPIGLVDKAYSMFSVPSTAYNETLIAMYVMGELSKMEIPFYMDSYGNIIVTKGEAPWSCFCAHLDTVHVYDNGFQIKITQENSRAFLQAVNNKGKSVGCGGDDKCGIFACLFVLERAENVRVVFFSREESGGNGSNKIDMKVFKGCKFLGGIDRWNGKDFVDMYAGQSTISRPFRDDIANLMKMRGYSYNGGFFTDAFAIQERKNNISTFNLSCGYYEHHTSTEYVDLQELYNSCLFALELTFLPRIYQFTPKYKYEKDTYWYKGRDAYNKAMCGSSSYKNRDYSTYKNLDEIRYCKGCGLELIDGEKDYCTYCSVELSQHQISRFPKTAENAKYPGEFDDFYD